MRDPPGHVFYSEDSALHEGYSDIGGAAVSPSRRVILFCVTGMAAPVVVRLRRTRRLAAHSWPGRSHSDLPVPLPFWRADSGAQGIQVVAVMHGEAQLAERWGDHGRQIVLDTSSVKMFLPGITDPSIL